MKQTIKSYGFKDDGCDVNINNSTGIAKGFLVVNDMEKDFTLKKREVYSPTVGEFESSIKTDDSERDDVKFMYFINIEGIDLKVLFDMGVEIDFSDLLKDFEDNIQAEVVRMKKERDEARAAKWDNHPIHRVLHEIGIDAKVYPVREKYIEGIFISELGIIYEHKYLNSSKKFHIEYSRKGLRLDVDHNYVAIYKTTKGLKKRIDDEIDSLEAMVNNRIAVQEKQNNLIDDLSSKIGWPVHPIKVLHGNFRQRHVYYTNHYFIGKVVKAETDHNWSEGWAIVFDYCESKKVISIIDTKFQLDSNDHSGFIRAIVDYGTLEKGKITSAMSLRNYRFTPEKFVLLASYVEVTSKPVTLDSDFRALKESEVSAE